MATITQTIPNLTGGISQQPDENKIPGQVKDMVNALPDVTQGLTKRPAGKVVASLSDGSNNSTTNGKWFHYYRDENEQYIGQIARDGVVRMWDCLTGGEKTVVNAIGNNTYLTHTGDEDIQTLTLNDFTYLNNRSVVTEMDTTTEPLGNFGKEIFVELKSISYAKQYALNLFSNTTTRTVTTATRIKVDLIKSSNNYCQTSNLNVGGVLMNGYMVQHTTGGDYGGGRSNNLGRCTANAGDGRDAFAPNVGTRIFNVGSGTHLVDTSSPGGIYDMAGTTTDPNYSYNLSIYGQNNYSVKLGFMSFFVKACVIGLKNFPVINSEIQGDEIVYKNYYNISIAVGTDRGLVVPVLRETDEMSFADIEKNISRLGEKARDGKITIDDLQGGTFTITNGGIYGSMLSTPILNPPQSAVLGMHNIINRPVVVEGNVEVRPIMYVALSYDHRIVDGKEAVSFLKIVKESLEQPKRLFLNI